MDVVIYPDGIVELDGVPIRVVDVEVDSKYGNFAPAPGISAGLTAYREVRLTLRPVKVDLLYTPYGYKGANNETSAVIDFIKFNEFDDDQLKLLESMCRMKRLGN